MIFAAPDNSILWVNKATCDMLGYSEEELLTISTTTLGLKRNFNTLIDIIKKNGKSITVSAIFQARSIGKKNYTLITLDKTVFSTLTEIEEVDQQFIQNASKSVNSVVSIWSVDNDFRYTFFTEIHRKLMKQTWGCDIKIGDRLPDQIQNQKYSSSVIKAYNEILDGAPHRSVDRFTSESGEENYRENFGNPIFDENNEISGIMFYAVDITEKVEAEQAIIKSLQEKEILLKEIHHRVKNNLQLISSMINLQISMVDDDTTVRILQDSLSRLKTMGSIHETLYLGEDLSRVNMKKYCGLLIKSFIELYNPKDSKIGIIENIEDISLGVEQAIPVGLIMSELITNSVKYAFTETAAGKITVSLTHTNGGYHLEVSDNGKGLPDDFNLESAATLGTKLVSVFTKQLGGQIEYTSKEGLRVDVHF